MDYTILSAELADDPLGRGYAAMTDQEVVDSLHAEDRTQVVIVFATWRTLLAAAGPTVTATIKAKIGAAAESNPAIALASDMLATYSDGGGLDMGHAYTRGVIDSLVTAEVLTADEAAVLKAVAERTVSRAVELGLSGVEASAVGIARGTRPLVQQEVN